MTTLIAWTGADQRGRNEYRPASVYFAADSRITWTVTADKWDCGRKLFASRDEPHLLGYCGDVLFPTQVLGRMIDRMDHGLMFPLGASPNERLDSVVNSLIDPLSRYPSSVPANFSLLYATREGKGTACSFHVWQIDFQKAVVQRVIQLPMPTKSGLLVPLGTGRHAFLQTLKRWRASEVGGTSRAFYSAFAQALADGSDPGSGGPPQLIGLYRQDGGRSFGTVWQGKRYFLGEEIEDDIQEAPVQWHNELFEICDPQTLARKADAQPQPRPRTLARPNK